MNGLERLRDELPNGEIFYTLRVEQVVIESWRRLSEYLKRSEGKNGNGSVGKYVQC